MITTRRAFLQSTTVAVAAASTARLQAQGQTTTARTARTSVLEVGYFEAGDPSGFPVLLLHGFPDDAHAYDQVAPVLARAGYRAISVFLRGFGPTRFLDRSAPRTAEQAAIGQDVIDLADALNLARFAVAGYDWGGRAAAVASVFRPDRVRAALLIGGYSIQNTVTRGRPGAADGARRLWYQWYLNTEIGRDGLEQDRRGFCRLLWREWSPTWQFSDEMFEQTAASFDNPDFVDCAVHSYRHRNFNAAGEARFQDAERRLAARPPITVPTLLLHGADDTLGRVDPTITPAERQTMPRIVAKHIVEGAGHFVPHEKPEPVAAALLELLSAAK
jgi:pimeloyl-ACP methyl ester carboxylesterase